MKQYLEMLNTIMIDGVTKKDRTGTGTKSIFGYQARYNLQEGFPLVTTKKLHLKSIIYELLWFLKGDTNIKYLNDNGVKIWNEWADENGDLNQVYGGQWRRWHCFSDEIIEVRIPEDGVDSPYEINHNDIFVNIDEKQKKSIKFNKKYENVKHKDFIITGRYISCSPNSLYFVKFNNGIEKLVSLPNLKSALEESYNIKNPFKSYASHGGVVGRNNFKKTKKYLRAQILWQNMMARCHDANHPNYEEYGKKGIFVTQRWRNFSNFL